MAQWSIERIQSETHFDEIERWSEEELGAWQLGRLQEAVAYAWERSPFYRQLWGQAGITPHQVGTWTDFRRLPIVSKEAMLTAGELWLRSGEGPVGFSTRGTSGEPLILWLGNDEFRAYLVPTLRGFWWAGLRPGMTALLMSPSWHRLAACESHAVIELGARAAYFWGSILGSQSVEDFVQALQDLRPQFITTTLPFLMSLLRRSERQEEELGALFAGVRSIVVVGLPLTPHLRLFLKERLGVEDIFERSGTQEGAALDECAWHTAPHVHADVCYLEVVDGAGRSLPPGKRGQLVVTKLVSGGSPFIRYNTEDIAAFLPDACPCGRILPRLKIYGRPESSVEVGAKVITAYDVRCLADEDPELVGRLLLLVRKEATPSVLHIAIEGKQANADALQQRLQDRLGVGDVSINWLEHTRIAWGFRQVIEDKDI